MKSAVFGLVRLYCIRRLHLLESSSVVSTWVIGDTFVIGDMTPRTVAETERDIFSVGAGPGVCPSGATTGGLPLQKEQYIVRFPDIKIGDAIELCPWIFGDGPESSLGLWGDTTGVMSTIIHWTVPNPRWIIAN
jgi:hypothetical protein